MHLAGVLTPFCQEQPVRGAMINLAGLRLRQISGYTRAPYRMITVGLRSDASCSLRLPEVTVVANCRAMPAGKMTRVHFVCAWC